jgi:ATP synthase protein I
MLMEKPPEKPVLRQLLEASSVGIHLVISTFMGLALGYWLDRFFDTSPWLTLLCLLLGIAGGFLELLRIAGKSK